MKHGVFCWSQYPMGMKARLGSFTAIGQVSTQVQIQNISSLVKGIALTLHGCNQGQTQGLSHQLGCLWARLPNALKQCMASLWPLYPECQWDTGAMQEIRDFWTAAWSQVTVALLSIRVYCSFLSGFCLILTAPSEQKEISMYWRKGTALLFCEQHS